MTHGKKAEGGEFGLIARYFAPLAAKDPNSFGLTDDAAIIAPRSGYELVVTADMMVAGRHFFADDPADAVARKLLRVNLSDLAAKGALPHGYILTIALPQPVSEDWVAAFARGLADDQRRFDITLIGGDTVSTEGPLCVSLTATGWVPCGQMLRRNGARAGDLVFVSGTLGDGALGLKLRQGENVSGLSEAQAAHLRERYLLPRPRATLGPRLVGHASAAIDISDGLVADLGHICQQSRCGAAINRDALPLSDAVQAMRRSGMAAWSDIIAGGDDYELAFTLPPDAEGEVIQIAEEVGVTISRIGIISEGESLVLLDEEGAELPLSHTGYQHF